MLKDGILLLRGVLPPSTCKSLCDLYDMFKDKGSQRDYNGNRVVYYKDLETAGRLALSVLAGMAQAYVQEWYEATQLIESVFLNRLHPGNVIEPHYDNVRPDGTTPNHTPQRSHSSLFYLSSFKGGEINFPNQGRKIKPQEGDFLAFPSGAPYMHFVDPVKSGLRYAAPVWFTTDPAKALEINLVT